VIAVDAMGGDLAPREIIKGAIQALQEQNIRILLVGAVEIINRELEFCLSSVAIGNNLKDRLDIIAAEELVTMDEDPVTAVRKKKNSSIVVATQLVRNSQADAVVSAGSTGAQMAAASLLLGRIHGIERPAVATILPSPSGPKILIDSGANVDCRAKHLLQFGYLGSIFAQVALAIDKPRIGLLNVGEEAGKGNELTKASFQLLTQSDLNFIGNVEGRDLFVDKCDVIVCDGFIGNVVLKTAEGLAKAIISMTKETFYSSWRSRLGGYLALPAFRQLQSNLDYKEFGGAPLLGVRKLSIICHGSSDKKAISNAIRRANEHINKELILRIEGAFKTQIEPDNL